MSKHGTFGVLIGEDFPMLSTLEPPDKNNQRDISCIPEGHYVCKRFNSPKFGDTFKITDVPNRGDIIFHWGNRVHETKGCVLLGLRFGRLNDEPAVISSKVAHKQFMEALEGEDEFALVIQNSYLYGAVNKPIVPIMHP